MKVIRIGPRHLLWLCFLTASLLVFPTLASGQASGVKPLITQQVNESHLTVLKGNTYPLARPEYDRGPAPASLPMDRMMLVLKRSPEQEAALGALLDRQQEKGSAEYHRWLTPAQFGQQFGLAEQDIQTIVAWLESQGFQIDRVANGRGVIEFSGFAGDVQRAFHTAIHKYVVKGKAHWANASDPEIPAALAPAVAGIVSLNNFPRRPMHRVAGIFRKSKTTGEVTAVEPTFNFNCGSGLTCYALGPYDFATIYNVLPLWNASIDGTGVTIAIVGESDINLQDVSDFRSQFGMPAPNLNVIYNGPNPGILSATGDETESDLDVEWAGAVAKGATIDFVVSESTETTAGVDLSAEYIVDNDLAPVMSESYGECELDLGAAGNQYYAQLWQQAAAEGITAMVASGDGGSAVCDFDKKGATRGLSVSGIASTPYDVAAGGTDFDDALDWSTYWNSTSDPTTQESAKGYIPEATWNDTCTNAELGLLGYSTDPETNCNNTSLLSQYSFLAYVVGGSGGASNCITSTTQSPSGCGGGYPKPSWQTGTGVPNDSARDVPDVSLFSSDGFNGHFYIVCQADQFKGMPCSLTNGWFLGVGGTSAAAPTFAAILAMAEQKAQARQGNANYVLYPLAAQTGASCDSSGTPGSSCIFYDVTTGTNAMPCVTGSPDCTTNTTGDSYGVLSGYDTTAGYDPATGLGSVNAANLVNGWGSVTFTPSATTLQLNGGTAAISVAHGSSVSVDISVTPASPLPTGDVSLIATPGSNPIDAGTFTLSNGVASGTTTLLPGGSTYNVIAHYAGDGTYGASDSSPVTVTVSAEASKTFANLVTLDASGNITSLSASSATYGSGYQLLRVDVGDSTATYSASTGISSTCSNHLASCPTGAVTLTNNGSPLDGGSLALNSEGSAEDQSLSGGAYAVSASYPGDGSYGASTGTANFTIAKAATTAVATVGTPAQYGNTTQVGAALRTTSDGIAPTGTFSFSLDGSPLAVSILSYSGFPYDPTSSPPSYASYRASGAATFMSVGSHTLTVQYSGDENYAAATSGATTFTVAQAQPYFDSLVANPSQVNENQQVTLTATLSGSQGAAPTGTITFYDGTTALKGTFTYTSTAATSGLPSSLQASMAYTPTTPGTHDISVKYSGDTNYLSASGVSVNLTVLGPDFSLSGGSPSTINIAAPGDSGTASLTVNSVDGFSGTVSLSVLCPSASAEMTCSLSPTSVSVNGTNSTATTTLTVTTTASSLLPPTGDPAGPSWPGRDWEFMLFGVFCLTLLLLWQRKRGWRWSTAAGVLVLASVLGGAGCGGGASSSKPSNPGTPTGSYTVTVTATSGNLSHSSDVTVKVL